jgi:NTP pyrophosphatase (non-canonical NTP hydrolase)
VNRLEHLMTILSEECGEVVQATTKAMRFGLDEGRDIQVTNAERMRAEVNDLIAMIEMLEMEGIDLSPDYQARADKKAKVEKYLLYSAECGTLSA